MNCLVFGGGGFIGSNLSNFLHKSENEVFVVDNFSTGKLDNLKFLPSHKIIALDVSELTAAARISEIINKNNIECIFHLAAYPSVHYSFEYPSLAHNSTLTTTINIIEALKRTPVKKLIFSSTSAIYGNTTERFINESTKSNPMSFYALQKLMSEQYLNFFSNISKTQVVCLRYFNVFGKNMNNEGAYRSVISIFREQYLNNQPLTIINDGTQTRDFISVEDVVQANIKSATMPLLQKFSVFNVGSGVSCSINDIADIFPVSKVFVGNLIEPLSSLCDNSKIKAQLNWNSTVCVKDWIKTNIINQ